MMYDRCFDLTPMDVPVVLTANRSIVTAIPHPDTLHTLSRLRSVEPQTVGSSLPVLWECAEDFSVYDRFGNRWIDCSSAGLIANCGHAMPEVRHAIRTQLECGTILHGNFASQTRFEVVELLATLAPASFNKVLITASDRHAIHKAAILAREYAIKLCGDRKFLTVRIQPEGSITDLGAFGSDEVVIPYPDGQWQRQISFDVFLDSIIDLQLQADDIASVIISPYVDDGIVFVPTPYMQDLSSWCYENEICLILDETRSGCGRTGTFWGFQHFGIEPDIICAGSNLSSSLPIGAILAKERFLLQPYAEIEPAGINPLSCSAAVASLRRILDHQLASNAHALEPLLYIVLHQLHQLYPKRITAPQVKGLLGGLQFTQENGMPDTDTAYAVALKCFQSGVLLNAPVGTWQQTLLITPPLSITHAAMAEALTVISDSVRSVLNEQESLKRTALKSESSTL